MSGWAGWHPAGSSSTREASVYQNGKGIMFCVDFTPLRQPKQPNNKGAKRRKNAKPKSTSAIFHAHEESELEEWLDELLLSLKDPGIHLNFNLLDDGTLIADFKIHYTVPRFVKNIELSCESEYQDMITQAKRKGMNAQANLVVVETKKANSEEDEGDTEDEDEDEESETRKKKGRVGPSPEEIAQNEIIIKLQRRYKCEDRGCPFDYCWPYAKQHVHLTHTHFLEWASSMDQIINDGKVDEEHPPHSKHFDPVYKDPADVLLQHRCSQNTTTTPQIPQQGHQFTFRFDGLPNGRPSESPDSPPSLEVLDTTSAIQRATKIPKIPLAQFIQHYQLTATIHNKLKAFEVTGPHALPQLSKEDLIEKGGLSLAQVADVRDAQIRWLAENPPLEPHPYFNNPFVDLE